MAEKPEHVLILNVLHLPFQPDSPIRIMPQRQTILHQKHNVSTVRKNLHHNGQVHLGENAALSSLYLVPFDMNVRSNETEHFVEGSSDDGRVAGKELDDMLTELSNAQRRIHENGEWKHLNEMFRFIHEQ